MIPLQIGFDIPNGYKIVMYPRSSLMIKYGIVQPTSVIDSDYSGMEVHVPLYNTSDKRVELPAGTRVAQIECVPVYDCLDWNHESAERTGGFGSTGSK
jgi:deoxyuridine 5'-triphosphate nucleotidohydrolase